ncbi:hypothetical protein [Helicobacter cetorum]|uniref:hypothetical protein n=1 Tax=Helicobacter cetorum TaxID=138563 RepID=UPI001F1D7A67|nr:hypothetical protein [Helicobacter cetorum]
MGAEEIRGISLFSSRPLVSSVSDGIITIPIHKRVFVSAMKSLFGESLFVKANRFELDKNFSAPLEHHHSFEKKYDKVVNGCLKYMHIHLPQGAASNFESGVYSATLTLAF